MKNYRQAVFSYFQTISRRVSTSLDSSIDAADYIIDDYSADNNQRETAREKSISLRKQRRLLLDWQMDISERISTISNKGEQKKLLSEINDKERELCRN